MTKHKAKIAGKKEKDAFREFAGDFKNEAQLEEELEEEGLDVKEAEKNSGFKFNMLQSDHGPEFGSWFVTQIKKSHRYTRIGKPNDNSHIERVNRTLQEECIDKVRTNPRSINCALKKYLRYYNYERLHMGINFKTPNQLLNSVQAIG